MRLGGLGIWRLAAQLAAPDTWRISAPREKAKDDLAKNPRADDKMKQDLRDSMSADALSWRGVAWSCAGEAGQNAAGAVDGTVGWGMVARCTSKPGNIEEQFLSKRNMCGLSRISQWQDIKKVWDAVEKARTLLKDQRTQGASVGGPCHEWIPNARTLARTPVLPETRVLATCKVCSVLVLEGCNLS